LGKPPLIHCYTPELDAFKEALFREYPSARKPFVSSADLDAFAKEKSKQEILILDDYASSIRKFRSWQHDWKREEHSGFLPHKAYESIPTCATKILFYLHDKKDSA